MNISAATADSLFRSRVDDKKPFRRDVIERGGASKLSLASRRAPRTFDILHESNGAKQDYGVEGAVRRCGMVVAHTQA